MEETTPSSRQPASLIPSVPAERAFSVLTTRIPAAQLILYVLFTLLAAVFTHCVLQIVSLIRKRNRDLQALKHFDGPTPHWLFGNVRDMVRSGNILGYQKELCAQFPGACRFMFGPKVMLRAYHPDTIRCTTTTEPKDNMMYRFLLPWIGDGLLVSQGRKWARNRRLLTPAFHFDILKPYVPVFSESAYTMVQKWQNIIQDSEQSLELFSHVSLMTLDSLMKCIFGFQGDCQISGFRHPYIQGVCELAKLVTERLRNPLYAVDKIYQLTPSGYRFRRACRVVHAYSKQVINERRQEKLDTIGSSKENKYLNFIDMLLDAKDEDGIGLTDADIQAEVDTFMFEGHDTTASAISWCLYNLATHPEYQAKCRDEVDSVLEGKEHFEWEDMSRLPFLTMCIKESLRKHPPVPNIGRRTTKPTQFPNGQTVPTDIGIVIGIYACHHNPDVWENPDLYDPYRFTSENSKGRSSHAFIPFSAGPRNCIGQHFALHEIRVSVGQVLRNFELAEDKTKEAHPVPLLVLRAQNGLYIKIKPRAS